MVQETTGRGPVVRGIYFIMHLSAYHSFAFSDSGLIPTKGTGSLSTVSRMALLLAMQMLPLIFFFLLTDRLPFYLPFILGLSLGTIDILN